MTISDRIAVMNAGRIEQIGRPSEIYNRPRTRFVADFIGEINLFEGEWRGGVFVSNGISLLAPNGNGRSIVAIRPERVRLTGLEAMLKGRVEIKTFVSGQMIYRVILDDGRHVTAKQADHRGGPGVGTRVGLEWGADDVVVLSD